MNGWLQFNAHEANEPGRLLSMGELWTIQRRIHKNYDFIVFSSCEKHHFYSVLDESPNEGRFDADPISNDFPMKIQNSKIRIDLCRLEFDTRKSVEHFISGGSIASEQIKCVRLFSLVKSIGSSGPRYFCSMKIRDFGWASQSQNFLFRFLRNNETLIISRNCELIYSRTSTVRHRWIMMRCNEICWRSVRHFINTDTNDDRICSNATPSSSSTRECTIRKMN